MPTKGRRTRMHRLPHLLALFALAALAPALSARAQYLFLDANGDGAHTAADVIQPSGTTTFDVWIVTNQNRDGSAAVCPSQDGDLTLGSYEFILHAMNGTVTYGAFVNQRPELPIAFPSSFNATDFYVGYGGGNALMPGKYRLGTLTVSVASGTPALAFGVSTPLSASYLTAFHSDCSGTGFDYNLKLGTDWFDADGAAYGGVANHPPVLAAISDATVPEGTMLDVGLTATDLDGQPLSFSLLSGPMFATVTTTSPGTGAAMGNVHFAPAFTDSGTYTASVSVSDGMGSDSKSFVVHVPNVDRAPVLLQPADMMPVEGVEMDQLVTASDSDGDPVSFFMVSGPMYMAVSTLNHGGGGLSGMGQIALTPAVGAAGMATGVVGVTDGMLSDSKSFMITVKSAGGTLMIKAPMMAMVEEGALLSFNVIAGAADTIDVDLMAMGLPPGAAFVDHGDHTGTFTWVPGFDQAGMYMPMFSGADDHGNSGSATVNITVTDVTRAVALAQPLDMHAIEGTLAAQTLRAFDASGDPLTFSKVSGPAYLTVSTTMPGTGLAQGQAELAPGFADAGSATATVAASDGVNREERTFGITVADAGSGPQPGGPPFVSPPMVLGTMLTPHTVTMGDLNGDGKLDLAVTNLNSAVVSIFLGRGDGTFGMRTDYMTGMMPHTVVIRDLNGDGKLDLTVSNMGANSIGTMLGNGDGTFQAMRAFMMPSSPMFCGVGDFDGDGIPDVVATDRTIGSMAVFKGKGDGTLQFLREYMTGASAHGLVIGDLNGDGKLDVIVANWVAKTVSVFLGRGDLTFNRLPDFSTPSSHTLSLGDLNGDGKLDLCVVNYDTGNVTICMGHGDGTFTPASDIATGAHAHGSAVADVDGDGLVDLLVANEAANTLSVMMGRGDGTFDPKVDFPTDAGSHSVAVGDLNGDGAPDLAISNINANTVDVFLNHRPPLLAAKAYTEDGSRMLRLMVPEGTWKVTVEPANGDFLARDVIPSSLALISTGLGAVARISAVSGKQALVADRNHDGVEELEASFAMSDLRRLFGPVRGRKEVVATIQGDLLDGRRFRTSFPVTLFFPPGLYKKSASVSPNPLNPEATLAFETAAPGRVTVRLYDVAGRLVRTVMDEAALAAGPHTLRMDGRDAHGVRLASGVYFFRVIGPDGESSGRFAILK